MNKQFPTICLFLLFCNSIFSQKVENLGSSVNSIYNEYSPVISPDGKTLYFLREGHPQNRSKEKYSSDVWSASNNGGKWMQASHLQNPFNLNVSNSIYSISRCICAA